MPTALSMAEFTGYLGRLLRIGDLMVHLDEPIGEQFDVDSSRLIELAIALEQECGIELPDDIDLRMSTPAELYRGHLRTVGEGS